MEPHVFTSDAICARHHLPVNKDFVTHLVHCGQLQGQLETNIPASKKPGLTRGVAAKDGSAPLEIRIPTTYK